MRKRFRFAFLVISLLACLASILLVLFFGNPENAANFDSIMQVGESILYRIHKTDKLLDHFPVEEEVKIGESINEEWLKRYSDRLSKDKALIEYVNGVGAKLARNTRRPGITYKFYIIESSSPNGFALPGGHIYITSALLGIIGSEAELAAILGHEMTHVDSRHAIEAVRRMGQSYRVFLHPGYSEVQEDEADIGGVFLAYKAGYSPLAVINTFENIQKMQMRYAKRSAPVTPIGDTLEAVGGMFDRYLSSHADAAERIKKIKKYVKEENLISGEKDFYIGETEYRKNVSGIVNRKQ